INGKVNIPGLEATIIPTNVRYTISGEAEIKDNQYSLKNGVVKDPEGGKGVLTAWMTNEKYKKVNYFIGVKANKMLGLNTNENDNSQFYGKAYATGDVTIKGDRNKIVLSVDATSSKRSTFFLPLGGRTISEVNFIKFASREENAESIVRSKLAKQREAGKNPTSFEMKMRLTATPLLETEIVMDPITGSSIKATGNGLIDIDIQPDNEVFTINGEYTIDKGTYRFILPNFNLVDKLFTIKNGSWIRWNGDPLNATLNVDAIYNVKASLAPLLGNQVGMANRVNVECVMALKGALTQPDITLGIEVPDAGPEEQSALKSVLNTQEAISTQLFFLLFSNSFYATSNGGTNTGNIGQ
ncbi:MAG: translocation/assembly module TamB domain-containing protein, partial [Rikenellaceae bacterium]